MFLAGDVIVQLVLMQPVTPKYPTLATAPDIAEAPGSQPEVAAVQQGRGRQHQLGIRQPFSQTAAHPQGKGVEDGAAALDAARAVVDEPAVRAILEGRGEVLGVVVDRVDGHAHVAALGNVQGVDPGAAVGVHFAPERGADRRRDAEGFVDAGAEVGARGQLRADGDVGVARELAADLVRGALVGVCVVGQVEEDGAHGRGGGVGPGDDERRALGGNLVGAEAVARLGVLGRGQVGEDVGVGARGGVEVDGDGLALFDAVPDDAHDELDEAVAGHNGLAEDVFVDLEGGEVGELDQGRHADVGLVDDFGDVAEAFVFQQVILCSENDVGHDVEGKVVA